jgi:ABC-type multidrug transport system fused ATPase/permease subunit
MFQFLQILTRKQINSLILILILMVIVGVLETFTLGAILPILSTFTNQSTEIDLINKYLEKFKGDNIQNDFIVFSCLILIASFLLKNIFLYIHTKFVAGFLGHLALDQQRKTFESYLSTSYLEIKDKSSAEILRDINQESKLVSGQYISPFLTLCLNTITITFMMVFLLIYNTKVTICLIIILFSIFYFLNYLFKEKLEKYGVLRQSLNLSILQSIKDTFDGLRELMIYKKKKIFLENFIKQSIKFTNVGIRRSIISVLPKLLSESLIFTVFMLVIIFFIFNGYTMSKIVAIISVYSLAGFRILPIFLSAVGSYQRLNYSKSALDLINKITSKSNNIDEKLLNNKVNFKNEILFENIFFSYEKENLIFKDFSLKIKKNSFTGVSGLSGSGKSTFVDLLIGLLEPQKGKILVDGISIKKLNNNYIDLFSYVQQKVYLFDSSILKNITFENDISEVNVDRLNYTLKFCELEKMVEDSPHGLKTNLGEYGSNISGGQLQRVGLARAIYKDSEIILLDEPLSNVDVKTKDLILDRIIELKANKTIIYISHDINDLKKCDSIIELKKI